MAEVTIELDEENETNTPFTETLEPKVILSAPPVSFLPLAGKPAISWERWLRSFELYLDSLGKANLLDSAKCVLLQHCLGKDGRVVYAQLLPGKTTYKSARAALTTYFSQHRDIQLLEKGTLPMANAELMGKQINHSSAPSLLLCVQNVSLEGEKAPHRVETMPGQRRSDRLKKRKRPAIPTPSLSSGAVDNMYYYSSDGEYYDEKDKVKCEGDFAGDDDSTVDSAHVDSDSTIDGNDTDDVDSHESRYIDIAGKVTYSCSSTKGDSPKDKLFCCQLCAKVFGRNYHLHRHMRAKHGRSAYVCCICKESVESSANPYSCTRCDYAFATLSELKVHMEQHNEDPALNCPHCGKLYLNKAKLERHVSIHTGERRHLCSICGHGFVGAVLLKSHMAVHSSEKAHKCTLCSKSFKTQSGLRSHSARHLAAPPRFPCSECGRSYGRMVELKMHQRYHTGDKAHKSMVDVM
uniref:C2H2-type domain-containing protein n=1 Tax=Gadus morhua TaxID=8049 RepID=A0A8C5FSI0_GADMO